MTDHHTQCLYSMMCIFSQDGESALMEAAGEGHTEDVTQLLEAGPTLTYRIRYKVLLHLYGVL